MTDINKLLNQFAAQEERLGDREFLAPCTRGGKVRTAIDKIIYTFTPRPEDFEGWGIFLPVDRAFAEVVDEPSLPQLAEYLQLLKPLRLRLLYALQGQTWLAYPVNESDMQQRFGMAKPIVVHLVSDGVAMETAIARVDGGICWFDEIDRRADPQPGDRLREELRQETSPEAVRFPGITPEMHSAYGIAWQRTEAGQRQQQQQREARSPRPPRQRPRDRRRERDRRSHLEEPQEHRLREALQQGGGELEEFRDRGDYWQVEWRTSDGHWHTSAIDKADLTVISSGVCLSGRDRDFDLQSLVGVMRYEG